MDEAGSTAHEVRSIAGPVVQIDEGRIQAHLDEVVRSTVEETLNALRLAKAAEIVESGVDETLSYYSFPSEHWRSILTNNPLERLNRKIRQRTRVVGASPMADRRSCWWPRACGASLLLGGEPNATCR